VVHQPVSRGLAVFADAWLSGWLAEISADLRENGSAVEVVSRRYAIQIHDFTLLLLQKARYINTLTFTFTFTFVYVCASVCLSAR